MIKFFSEGHSADFTADGDVKGTITVASTTGFYAGSTAWISSDTQESVRVVIKKIVSATVMKAVRIAPGDYRLADLSSFLLADNAHIDMEPQLVSDEVGRATTSPSPITT